MAKKMEEKREKLHAEESRIGEIIERKNGEGEEREHSGTVVHRLERDKTEINQVFLMVVSQFLIRLN